MPRAHRPSRRREKRRGQVLVFFILVVVVLTFVALWNFDLHKLIFVRSVTQNAGDAAAVMAARWQGITLNLVGELNIMQAIALAAGDMAAVDSITNMQARLLYVGPMIAFMASQHAAKNNGIYVHPGYTDLIAQHAETVRTAYGARQPGGDQLFPEPFEDAWTEYAEMLSAVAANGVAAAPDNARFYTDYLGGHYLLVMGFYDAIAGRTWCWFYHNAPHLLEDYVNFFPAWWDPLPDIPHVEYRNSEIYGLGLTTYAAALEDLVDQPTISSMAAERGILGQITPDAMSTTATWYCYGGLWSDWDNIATDGPDPFPLTGEVKPQYDYAGADAIVRLQGQAVRLTPGPGNASPTNTITWIAAAKPFGHLEGENAEIRPNSYNIVLPAFHQTRLIPLDAALGGGSGSFNLEWRTHVEEHLDVYMEGGPTAVANNGCWYCRQLVQWEDAGFRSSGVSWLAANSRLCTVTVGGGGGHRGGGRRYGH